MGLFRCGELKKTVGKLQEEPVIPERAQRSGLSRGPARIRDPANLHVSSAAVCSWHVPRSARSDVIPAQAGTNATIHEQLARERGCPPPRAWPTTGCFTWNSRGAAPLASMASRNSRQRISGTP